MIHILTLNWNGLSKLQALGPSLAKGIKNFNAVWHVRDNGSQDGSLSWLKKFKEVDTNVLSVDHNRSNFSQGMNSLISLAEIKDDDYVMFLNNDVVFKDDKSITSMLMHFAEPKVGIVGARLMYSGSDVMQHAGVIFGPRYGMMPYHFKHKEKLDSQSKKSRYFQAVTAACCLVRGKVINQLGSFDEKFHWAFEDIDFCLRAGQEKWKVVYCGSTEIEHEESASLKKNPVNRMMSQPNVSHFKAKWWRDGKPKYDLDHEMYLKAPNWNVVRNS